MFWSLFFQTLIFIVVIVAAGQLIAKIFASKNQGDFSTPITAVAETLSDYRATNVRAGI